MYTIGSVLTDLKLGYYDIYINIIFFDRDGNKYCLNTEYDNNRCYKHILFKNDTVFLTGINNIIEYLEEIK